MIHAGKSPLLLLLSLIISAFYFVHGRVHQHKNHHHHQSNSSSGSGSSIALPPSMAEPPSPYSHSLPPMPPPPSLPPNVFDVTAFGAAGNGVADDTEAFRNAWDSACQSPGSGVLLAPSGHSFMIRSIIFAGPCEGKIVFQVNGIVMPPDGPDSWPQNNSRRQWLVFYRADGLSLRGPGLIDGRGHKWWDLPCKPHRGINGTTLAGNCDSPAAVRFFLSSNLAVSGIKMQNSPQFHLRFDSCKNITIDSCKNTHRRWIGRRRGQRRRRGWGRRGGRLKRS